MTVLVITNESDITADAVIRKLTENGSTVFRLNTERICEQFNFTIDLSASSGFMGRIASLFHEVDLRLIKSVYFRRPAYSILGELAPEHRDFVAREIRCFLRWLWLSLSREIFWINKPHKIRDAESKIDQLRMASSLGFNVPRTIITNQPESARRFYEECSGEAITKTLGPGYVAKDNERLNIYANRILYRHLSLLDNVRFVPCLFQEYIQKAYEVRVTVVGSSFFSAEIHSQQSERTRDDWRRYDLPNTPHKIHDLPISITKLCLAMMKEYDLFFGAFDFIVDKDGRYVFLELNPNGQWLWIEHLTGLQILDSIAEALSRPPQD